MHEMLIDGKLVPGAFTLDVVNPATEEVFATCARASEAQLNEAVAAARRAAPAWGARPIAERRAALLALSKAVADNAETLGRVITSEQGKPLSEGLREAMGAAGMLAGMAKLDLEDTLIEDGETRHVTAMRVPLGVVAAICPWNFPLLLPAMKIGPALLAGNTMVIKPAPTTPLALLELGRIAADILPPGVLNIIVDDNDLGALLTGHPDVAKISFTGSTATGARVMAAASADIKRVTLELGGNDAAIVLEDVDPVATAQALFDAAFGNSGQVCIAAKRLYLHDAVHDAITAELVRLAEAAVVDDGMKQGTTLGPVQNRAQYDKLVALMAEAARTGQVLSGGAPEDRPGYFIRPTLVAGLPDDAPLVAEEQFGPVVPILRFSDLDDVVSRANATPFGLGASVWTQDMARARALAARLQAGTVWINKHKDLAPHIPFGGAKTSGLGTELAREGLEEFTQLKVINAKV